MPLRIEGLIWTDEIERHVEKHINAWEVEELIEGGDFFQFPNTKGHPPDHRRFIGRTDSGTCVTAILKEPDDGDPSHWLVVTGWRSAPYERTMYQHERKRIGKKRGR